VGIVVEAVLVEEIVLVLVVMAEWAGVRERISGGRGGEARRGETVYPIGDGYQHRDSVG